MQSIGFFQVEIDDLSFTNVEDLFETLIPPALFVAVMALQLKYFSPLDVTVEEAMAHSSLTEEGDDNTPKLLQKLIKYIHIFAEFCWRFLEIYLDKVITIVAFVLVLQQVSSTHIITLLILLGPIVGMRATRVWYPMLTLYISVLIMLKMMYQVRMVGVDTFDLTDECSVSNRVLVCLPLWCGRLLMLLTATKLKLLVRCSTTSIHLGKVTQPGLASSRSSVRTAVAS